MPLTKQLTEHLKPIRRYPSVSHNLIAAVAGLLTGGVIGALLSPIALNLCGVLGLKGRGRWMMWLLLGVVGAPLSLIAAYLISPTSFTTASYSIRNLPVSAHELKHSHK